MKVLLVEDDDDKALSILEFVENNYGNVTVETAKSLQTGLQLILNVPSDLILLDMTMRNYDRTLVEDGGRPHAFAGREILRQMRRERILTPVIVVTHFHMFGDEKNLITLSELNDQLREKFPNYLGSVQFKSNVEDWKPALRSMIGSRLIDKV